MRRILTHCATLAFLTLNFLAGSQAFAGELQARLIRVERIWDQGEHNAFTDLIRFQDHWYCVFREGKGHVSPDGVLQVLRSQDGQEWESVAVIRSPSADLRDPKICITPQGHLMMTGAGAIHQPADHRHQSYVWFSQDGVSWSNHRRIGDPDFWLWRVTWHDKTAYSIGYATTGPKLTRLYSSQDGKQFTPLVKNLFDVGYPNESSLLFDGDLCLCLLRRDGEPNSALLGKAKAPYTDWVWQELERRIGGPRMIQLPSGEILVAGRDYTPAVKTKLWQLDSETGKLKELVELPSGGDTSYPGLVWHDDQLWMSYYSSHEGKTCIYLARIELSRSEDEE